MDLVATSYPNVRWNFLYRNLWNPIRFDLASYDEGSRIFSAIPFSDLFRLLRARPKKEVEARWIAPSIRVSDENGSCNLWPKSLNLEQTQAWVRGR